MIQVDRCLFTYSPSEVVAEASELGLKPGEWPDMIAITDDLNQGYLVIKATAKRNADGDVMWVEYMDRAGHLPVVRIFND